jgi:predicted dehydrogenase
MKKLKVAVIGVGHLGKEHVRIYSELPEAELIAICDVDARKVELAKKHRVSFTTNYREILSQVDAVSIVTPTVTHYEVAKDALSAGVNVLIEKPIAPELGQADELIELARANHLALKVGHLERYNAGFKRIEQIARNIRFIEVHRLGPFNSRIRDCGVVLDLMIHDIDILLQLVDSEIESLDAMGINVLTPFEDIANVRIKFKNKAIADITASRLTPEAQRKIRIFQEDAYISLDYVAQTAQIFKKSGFPAAIFGGKISREDVDIKKEEPLKAELADFVQSVSQGTIAGKPDVQAREALRVALDILDSIRENAPTPLHA